ncbi:hypothetical protein J2X84_003105 [Pseudomonas corrugata]|uniref:hypothetical protein n=1 Tax=Pseudomonas corrugata TaxID=47879 RepID=UPI00285F3431|nr:hypothetical protein [Pseudomonas corrugata]MDR7284272.1 hypothetical protein [Pseudomonas corrugata]
MSDDNEIALDDMDDESSLAPQPLQIQFWEFEELFDTTAKIVFNVPQSDGEHQVWIKYYAAGYYKSVCDGESFKGMQWNTREHSEFPQGQGYYLTWWNYKGEESPGRRKYIFVAGRPKINTYNQFSNSVGGIERRFGTLRVVEHGTARELSSAFSSNGSWIKTLHEISSGNYQVVIEEKIPNHAVRYSEPFTIECVRPLNILLPEEGASLANQVVTISGNNGLRGADIEITNSAGSLVWGRGVVGNDGSWRVNVDFTNTYNTVTLYSRHVVGNRTQSSRTYILPPAKPVTPVITAPAASSPQNPSFTLSGTGGKAGATMRVYLDLTQTMVGQALVNGDAWSVQVNVQPGSCSLVVEQTLNGDTSTRSEHRSFKVRPRALNGVDVTSPSETVLKFSGPGHTGATVEITVVSGPGGTAPSAVTVTGGRWETTVTNWPFGSYSLKAIQKVSDNANGWIESAPYTFTVNRVLPDPSDIEYTNNYQPTFTGTGYNHATVKIADPGGSTFPAPNALVSAGKWSSRASQEWGPTFKRDVYFRQFLDGQQSPTWVHLIVTIPPLAPVIGPVEEDGFSPKFSGTCWLNAVVKLAFSDDPNAPHSAIVTGTNWTFQRGSGFAPDVPHTVTVTQFVAGQTSPSASVTFTVYTPMLKPLIFEPEPDSQVGRDVTVKGQDGMAGATMQLRDAQSERDLGDPKLLTADGDWSIDLTGLEFREYTIDAQQTLNQRESERSDRLDFEVVLLPPVFTQPTENGDLPRTATLEGEGMPGGRVEVWLAGDSGPLLMDIPVDMNGCWEAVVTLSVGGKVIWARQTFEGQTSEDSPSLNYNVVPAAPFIETPALDEHIGRLVVISGFGVPRDRVTVRLGDAVSKVLGRSPVLEDRTWSVTLMLNLPGGRYGLVAVASCDGFESADSPERSVVLGAFLPSIDVPAAGRWASDPVHFEGQGKAGIGQVMSWYNPDLKWVLNVDVSPSGWRGSAAQPLPDGGNWCRFNQTLTDSDEGETVSDWTDSKRFEVGRAPSTKS